MAVREGWRVVVRSETSGAARTIVFLGSLGAVIEGRITRKTTLGPFEATGCPPSRWNGVRSTYEVGGALMAHSPRKLRARIKQDARNRKRPTKEATR